MECRQLHKFEPSSSQHIWLTADLGCKVPKPATHTCTASWTPTETYSATLSLPRRDGAARPVLSATAALCKMLAPQISTQTLHHQRHQMLSEAAAVSEIAVRGRSRPEKLCTACGATG